MSELMAALGGKQTLRVAPCANAKLSRYPTPLVQTIYATAKTAATTKTCIGIRNQTGICRNSRLRAGAPF